MLLENKVVFLTGGSTGIGQHCAMAYAEEGAKVVIFALNEKEIEETLGSLGPGHLGIAGDISDPHAVKGAISQTLNVYGRIDAIHNNAGIAHPSKQLHQTSEDEFHQLMNVNIKGIYHTTCYGLEALIKTSGTILNTSSLVAEIGQERHAVYAASKGAVNALTRSMALDYAPYRIRVNAVAPAGVWTPMLRSWSSDQPQPELMEKYLDGIHPIGYCPEGDVIADACVFLLSDKSAFITGCILPVSGGAELGYRNVFDVKDIKSEG